MLKTNMLSVLNVLNENEAKENIRFNNNNNKKKKEGKKDKENYTAKLNTLEFCFKMTLTFVLFHYLRQILHSDEMAFCF